MVTGFDYGNANDCFEEVSGRLHTENKSVVVFKLAPNTEYGIRFVRMDLPNKPEIKSIWSNASSGLVVRGSVMKKTV